MSTPNKVTEVLERQGENLKERGKGSFLPKNYSNVVSNNNIEETAIITLKNMIANWDRSSDGLDSVLKTPDDYSNSVKQYYETYEKFRINLDASFAFATGSTLNKCREIFFENEDKNFKKHLETTLPFSVRQAYDYMAIAKELHQFKDKKLKMEKLRALLSVSRSGFDMNQLYSKVETLDVKDILSFKGKKIEEGNDRINLSVKLSHLNALSTKLEDMMKEIDSCLSTKKLTEKQLSIILSSKVKIESVLSSINNNISIS